jgi:OmpA-OmpF porin, OOP family
VKKVNLFLIAFCFMFGAANAQTSDHKWGVGIMMGDNQYKGELGNSIFKFNEKFYGFGSLSLHRYLNPSFNLGIQGTYGKYGFEDSQIGNFEGNKFDASLLLSYKFNNGYILKESSKVEPYVALGLGLASYSGDNIDTDGNDFVIPMAIGVKYHLTDWAALKYQFLYGFTNEDSRDLQPEVNTNDRYAQQSIGVVFSFGGSKDSDKDGVENKIDICPNTPKGVSVTKEGCAVDSDGDGTADYLDKCPDVKGTAEFNGCPDSDQDGIPDSEDKCPNVKGVSEFNGCPDTDGDGIQDTEDKCPKIKGTAAFNGCPDTDGDGVPDQEDRCPKIKGTVAMKGCPDSDNDGVADIDDRCPNEAGLIANKGCPDLNEEEKEVLKQALEGVNFLSGKDVLTATSKPKLDNVAKILNKHSSYKLKVSGYTDSDGGEAANLELSKKRAKAVKDYLVSYGIAASRITSEGYGESNPVADNGTSAGRAKNRRVEFEVGFE